MPIIAASMDNLLPNSVDILFYHEGPKPTESFTERMQFISFEDVCREKQRKFEDLAKPFEKSDFVKQSGEWSFKFQASRFAHKYYACEHAIKNTNRRYLIWIDADVIALQQVPESFFLC